ncbi:ATP-binding cassette domain-containing protein [Actinotalea sp.]|uniref:ABC transporter ATP-binding protein n=1 Tax=Actinotalea sp. TaxID=1872145 RepID=UPI003565B8A4
MDATPTLAVSSSGLTKRFASGQVAVDGIDLAVPSGAVYGFLGPNGSGKTTTIRMLLGLLHPTSGEHSLLGRPMPSSSAEVLPRVGALVEGPAFHPYLSGRDNLMRLDSADRTVTGRTASARVAEALDRVGLGHAAGKRYRHYSLGMRQRLGLAATLLRPRELLVLDEPTNGLDPQGTREVRALLLELAAAGSTVVLSTHLLSEVEQLCTDVGVMHRGSLVAQDTLAALRTRHAPRAQVTTTAIDEAAEVLRAAGLADVTIQEGRATALLGSAEPEALVASLVGAGVPVRGFAVVAATLEETFVELTGEGFDVAG